MLSSQGRGRGGGGAGGDSTGAVQFTVPPGTELVYEVSSTSKSDLTQGHGSAFKKRLIRIKKKEKTQPLPRPSLPRSIYRWGFMLFNIPPPPPPLWGSGSREKGSNKLRIRPRRARRMGLLNPACRGKGEVAHCRTPRRITFATFKKHPWMKYFLDAELTLCDTRDIYYVTVFFFFHQNLDG